MDLGFHSLVSRALLIHVTGDQGRCRAILHNADTLSHTIHAMDSRADKQRFLEQYHGAFMIPKRLEFQAQAGDEAPIEPELQKALHAEMEQRLQHLGQRVGNLRTESEEIWKTLETAEINLLEILNAKDYDSSSHFGDGTTQTARPDSLTVKAKADKQEIEEFYITVSLLTQNRILQSSFMNGSIFYFVENSRIYVGHITDCTTRCQSRTFAK